MEVTRCAYDKFVEGLNDVKDSETLGRLSENMAEQFQQCLKSYEACRSRLYKPHDSGLTGTTEIDFDTDSDVKPSDSVSQVSARASRVSEGTSISSGKSSLLRRIELDQEKAELKNMEELTRARARGKALQAAAAAASAAEAEAQEVEALAKLRMEAIKLDAEERLLACSGEGLSVSGLSRLRSRVRSGFEASSDRAREARSNRSADYVTPGTTRAEKVDPSCALKAVPTVPPGFSLQHEESTADTKPFVVSDQICKPTTTTYYTGTLTDPLPKRHLNLGSNLMFMLLEELVVKATLALTATVITMKVGPFRKWAFLLVVFSQFKMRLKGICLLVKLLFLLWVTMTLYYNLTWTGKAETSI